MTKNTSQPYEACSVSTGTHKNSIQQRLEAWWVNLNGRFVLNLLNYWYLNLNYLSHLEVGFRLSHFFNFFNSWKKVDVGCSSAATKVVATVEGCACVEGWEFVMEVSATAELAFHFFLGLTNLQCFDPDVLWPTWWYLLQTFADHFEGWTGLESPLTGVVPDGGGGGPSSIGWYSTGFLAIIASTWFNLHNWYLSSSYELESTHKTWTLFLHKMQIWSFKSSWLGFVHKFPEQHCLFLRPK